MTINAIVKVKAESGQLVITDSVHGFTWGGTATVSLVNDGTYGYLWRVVSGNLTSTITGLGNWTDTTPTNTAIVIRFRVSNRQAAYTRYCSVGYNTDNIQSMGNNGTSTGTIRGYMVLGGSAGNAGTFAYTNDTVKTVVIRLKENGTSSDPIDTWVGTTGRVGTTPDATANNNVAATAYGLNFINFNAASGETIDILNFAVVRDMTDAEAASVADDVTQLWSGGATNGTASGTPDTLDLIAPSATAVGTGGANGSASGSPSPASITAPVATAIGTTAGSGTITTPALKNNTGTILASISGWTLNVYNASTGALVVQKTGLTTSAGGMLTVTDASITTGTTYAYEPAHATYGRRLPTGAAS